MLPRRRRLHLSRILFFLSGVLVCCIYQLTIRANLAEPWLQAQVGHEPELGGSGETEGHTSKDSSGQDDIGPIRHVTTPPSSPVADHPIVTSVAAPPTVVQSTTTLSTERISSTTHFGTTATVAEPTKTGHGTVKPDTTAAMVPFPPSTEPTSGTTTHRTTEHCIYTEPDQSEPSPVPSPFPATTRPSPPAPVPPVTPPETKTPHAKAEYPEDIFSVEDRQRGWVALHIFGMVYMFVALAIVCDEFFVPTLGVITDKLEISDDVAGATFMAAGGSAPELFTSLIGVFISHSNVGIGTIVGSAVFNILFVIGMCALFSREILHLTWWPLFRDVSFYILDLIMLIIFFLDNTIMPWESMMLICGYTCYVIFMKFNVQIEQAFKSVIMKHKSIVKVIAVEEPEKDNGASAEDSRPADQDDKNRLKLKPALQRGGSSASLHNSTMRSTIFQLMIHTLDPLGEVKFKEKAQFLNNMARSKQEAKVQEKPDAEKSEPSKEEKKEETKEETNDEKEEEEAKEDAEEDEEAEEEEEGEEETNKETKGEGSEDKEENGKEDQEEKKEEEEEKEEATEAPAEEEQKEEEVEKQDEAQEEAKAEEEGGEGGEDGDDDDSEDSSDDSSDDDDDDDEEEEEEEEEENEEPLSLEWPDTRRKQATYLFLLPIVFPLWLTVPDVRNPASKKFFAITFLGSILWIAAFSYLMVWWAHQVGETVGISEEIMGLTILAAGTSIPDLITSVIVARKGLGDMAVSSSVGSNIFDITVGLPVPWLLWSGMHNFSPVAVSSNGLFCAIVLLFLMLLFVIISIAACKWRMNKVLGSTMFLLYFVFLVLSVMLEDRIIICPVSI